MHSPYPTRGVAAELDPVPILATCGLTSATLKLLLAAKNHSFFAIGKVARSMEQGPAECLAFRLIVGRKRQLIRHPFRLAIIYVIHVYQPRLKGRSDCETSIHCWPSSASSLAQPRVVLVYVSHVYHCLDPDSPRPAVYSMENLEWMQRQLANIGKHLRYSTVCRWSISSQRPAGPGDD